MKDLRKLLKDTGIVRVIVIDDVFDDTPRPDEISEEGWTNFFDDIDNTTGTLLSELYADYETTSVDDLKISQEFVKILWDNRHRLGQKEMAYLFKDYETTKNSERSQLDILVKKLQSLNLICRNMGRFHDASAIEADLIFIDLFMGFHQLDADMDCAIQLIHNLVKNRIENPPLIILMSRSSRLHVKRDEFRDKAGLLGSMFRVVSKTDLTKEGILEAMLMRLASHYEDAKRMAYFVHAWENGLERARANFIKVLRRLDLSDLGQIRALLLDHEGLTLGEYLLDVSDRVLQYEIEGDDETITSALELNKVDFNKYPAPHLIGTPDLQEFVHRMVFLHSNRLHLSEDSGEMHLQFGDILRWKESGSATYADSVSLVVNPACDLVRDGTEYVVLLCGVLEDLQPKSWSYKTEPLRTAIVILPDEDRKWIKWNLKNIKTLNRKELDKLISKEQKLKRIGRLREIYAIEIQQKLLAHLGRIGRTAILPVSFPVTVSFFYVDSECKARKIHVQEIESAACYVGRDADSKPVHRLVLTEQTCDQIDQALRVLKDDDVHNSSKTSLAAMKKDRGFFTRFERGEIEIPLENGKKNIIIDNRIYATIIRNREFEEGADARDLKKAALIVNVTDIREDD